MFKLCAAVSASATSSILEFDEKAKRTMVEPKCRVAGCEKRYDGPIKLTRSVALYRGFDVWWQPM